MGKCSECENEIADKEEGCPDCNCVIEDNTLQTEFASEEKIETTKNKEDKLPIKSINKKMIVVVMFLCLIICSVGIYGSHKKNELIKKQSAETESVREYNSYIDSLNTVYANSLKGASDAEEVCVLVHNVWGDSIYSNYSDEETSKYVSGTNDFNEAIDKVYEDAEIQKTINSIQDSQESIGKHMQKLQNCPTDLEKAYDLALDTYTAFETLAELALQPSGNYNSFGESEKNSVNNFITAYKSFGAVIPPKKTVPIYDGEGQKIDNDFSFDIYIHQKADKLPNNVDDSLAKLGSYKDTCKIGKYNAELVYFAHSGLIDSIMCEIENTNETVVSDILNKLETVYGEDHEDDKEKMYSWNNEKTLDSILMSVEDEKITITWFDIK